MNDQERKEALSLVSKAMDLENISGPLKEMLIGDAHAVQGVVGIEIYPGRKGSMFEFAAHGMTGEARYVQVREADAITGRIYCCKIKPNEELGDVILTVVVRANGDVEFPDAERLDLWPKNDPNPAEIRAKFSWQLLRAAQNALPKM